MKLSELKEQIKKLHSLQEETVEDVNALTDAYKELQTAKDDAGVATNEGKVTKSQFEAFLREEILETLNEQEEDEISDDVSIEDEEKVDAETFDFDKPSFEPTGAQDIDAITDELVVLARKAKEMNQLELANQILNSAKYSSKTQFKDVEAAV
jgi:hypothetical protein